MDDLCDTFLTMDVIFQLLVLKYFSFIFLLHISIESRLVPCMVVSDRLVQLCSNADDTDHSHLSDECVCVNVSLVPPRDVFDTDW